MAMTKERKNEIAYAVLKRQIIRTFPLRELTDANDIKKRIGQLAQEMGLPKEELLEFTGQIIGEILKETNEGIQKISFKR